MVGMKGYQFFLGTKLNNSAKTKMKIFQILLSSSPRLQDYINNIIKVGQRKLK